MDIEPESLQWALYALTTTLLCLDNSGKMQ